MRSSLALLRHARRACGNRCRRRWRRRRCGSRWRQRRGSNPIRHAASRSRARTSRSRPAKRSRTATTSRRRTPTTLAIKKWMSRHDAGQPPHDHVLTRRRDRSRPRARSTTELRRRSATGTHIPVVDVRGADAARRAAAADRRRRRQAARQDDRAGHGRLLPDALPEHERTTDRRSTSTLKPTRYAATARSTRRPPRTSRTTTDYHRSRRARPSTDDAADLQHPGGREVLDDVDARAQAGASRPKIERTAHDDGVRRAPTGSTRARRRGRRRRSTRSRSEQADVHVHVRQPDEPHDHDRRSAQTDEMCMATGYFFPATKPTICYSARSQGCFDL